MLDSYDPCENMSCGHQHRPQTQQYHQPDTTLGSTWVPGVTLELVAAQAIQISVTLVAT